jgi:hypothetical protein
MRRASLIAFGCTVALTGFLLLVRVVIFLALMAYYRPVLEHAYNDELALQDLRYLGILRECYRWNLYILVASAVSAGLLASAIFLLRRSRRQTP